MLAAARIAPSFQAAPRVHQRALFEARPSDTASDVIRVRNRNTGQAMYSGFTRRVDRPRALPADTALTFEEAPVGQPAAVHAWFPLGLRDGHEFIY